VTTDTITATPSRLLDPTAETATTSRARVAPLPDLRGATIGLVSISKERSDEFMDHLERRLVGRGLRVRRFAKPTHTKPAPEPLVQQVVEGCEAVVQALAD
jgi:hypothetical protein